MPVNPIIPTPLPFIFTNGSTADGSQVNSDLNTIVNAVNALQSNGSWTPTDQSGAGLTFTGVTGGYTKIGNMVFAYGNITWPSTANGANVLIGGLPYPVANTPAVAACGFAYAGNGLAIAPVPQANTSNFAVTKPGVGNATNANMSTAQMNFLLIYPLA